MVIKSLENDKIKLLVKLSKKKYRDEVGLYLVEGEHLVSEAYKANVISYLVVQDGLQENYDCEKIIVTYEVMKKISNMDNPPSIMAVCRKSDNNVIAGSRIVLLDEIQDPGNLGTIIRSSMAFNIDTIILTEGSVDLYNSKVLRGTQGMIFHINIVSMKKSDAVNYMIDNNIPIYGTSVVDGVDVSTLSSVERGRFCLAMGNEGNGLSDDIFNVCSKKLYIKMNDKVESLNVGVACSILLYELGR